MPAPTRRRRPRLRPPLGRPPLGYGQLDTEGTGSLANASTRPRIFYGWFILAAGFFALFVSMGARNGFGLFVVPMSDDLAWSRTDISAAISIGILVNGLSQPFLGRLYDRFGGRVVISLSLLTLGLSTMLLAVISNFGLGFTLPIRIGAYGFNIFEITLSSSLLYLVVIYGLVMSTASSGVSLVTVHAVLAKWFFRRRGIVLSICTAGTSVGGLILTPFTASLIIFAHWRVAWMVMGVLVLILALPLVVLFMRERPEDVGEVPDGGDGEPMSPQVTKMLKHIVTKVVVHGASHLSLATASFFVAGAISLPPVLFSVYDFLPFTLSQTVQYWLMLLIVQALLGILVWRKGVWVLIQLVALPLVGLLNLVALITRDKQDSQSTPASSAPLESASWKDSFRSPPIWQLSGAYFVCGVTTLIISTHYVPFAEDLGISKGVAAIAFGMMQGLNAIGVMVVGVYSDKFSRKNMLGSIYFMRFFAYVMLVTPSLLTFAADAGMMPRFLSEFVSTVIPPSVGIWTFAYFAGMSWIATPPLTSSLTADIYGTRNLGTLGGFTTFAHQIGGSVSVFVAGILYDHTGTYVIPFGIAGLTLLGATVASYAIRERRYSIRYQAPAVQSSAQEPAVARSGAEAD